MLIKNNYSVVKKIQLAIWLFRTKLVCRKARIIRFPFDLRGKTFVDFGEMLTTGVGCRIEAFSTDGRTTLHFGFGVQINDYVHISAMQNVWIGNHVLMASNIYISDNSHGYYKGDSNDVNPDIPPIQRVYYTAPVVIEDNVWLGESVIIMPGVTIGRGSIIGALSVVTKSIPSRSIAVGNPAKVIKAYNVETKRWEKSI